MKKIIGKFIGLFIPKVSTETYVGYPVINEKLNHSVVGGNSFNSPRQNRFGKFKYDSTNVPTPASMTVTATSCKVNSVIRFTVPMYTSSIDTLGNDSAVNYMFYFDNINCGPSYVSGNVMDLKMPSTACTVKVWCHYVRTGTDGKFWYGNNVSQTITVSTGGTLYSGVVPVQPPDLVSGYVTSINSSNRIQVYSIPYLPNGCEWTTWEWVVITGTDPTVCILECGLSALVFYKNGQAASTGKLRVTGKNIWGSSTVRDSSTITVDSD